MKKLILFSLLLLSSAYVSAVNPVALWMPVSLQALMPQLMKAAEMAEATERCDKVMSGRHSSKRSTVERPVFSIVCRDAETKRTYSILYAVENGEVVEFNEQQRITGAKGETLARPWENPALKPVENTGATQSAASTTAPITTTAPTATTTTLAVAPTPVVAEPSPTSAAPPETPIDSRLAKLMARLEAAGVKGASAKVMMEDMQKKTLEDNLAEYDQTQAKRTSAPKVKSAAPIAAAANKLPAEVAAELANKLVEKSAALAASSPVVSAPAVSAPTVAESAPIAAAEKPAVPASPAAEISNTIATQLWSQCLPAIKAKTASMIDRVLDEKTIPQGYSADAGATRIDVPFEAKNPEGQSLRFLAICTVDASGAATVKLRPRRE